LARRFGNIFIEKSLKIGSFVALGAFRSAAHLVKNSA
jgi:hypothetical protein